VLVSLSSLGLEQIENPPTVATPGIKKSTLRKEKKKKERRKSTYFVTTWCCNDVE